MKRTTFPVSVILIIAAVVAVLGGRAISADKYTVQVPGGLAFSEFRGYEDWPVISTSDNNGKFAAILGNPVMMDALRAGVPGNGKPFPDGAKMAKIHWTPKTQETYPGQPKVLGTQANADFMVKDSTSPVLKPFCRQNQSRAVENEELQTTRSLRAEHENVPAVWLAAQSFRHQCDQAMYAFTEVDRLCRDEHPDIRAERYHRVDLTAASTRSSVAASTPTGTLTVAPAIVTSIRSARPATTRGGSIASGRASTASSSLSCTNCGSSLDESRALRRHTVSNPRLTPLRRATSDTFTPGAALSARIRAFSSSLQSRRRRRPVISSTR